MPIPQINIEGQSNADGTYDALNITDVPTRTLYSTPFAPVQMMELQSNAPVVPQTWDRTRGPISLQTQPGGSLGSFGIEMGVGHDLYSAGITCAISKVSVRGASLAVDLGVGTSYDTQCIARQQLARTTMGTYIFACCWLQGEADAGSPTQASAYATNLTNRINNYRSQLGPTLDGGPIWMIISRVDTQGAYTYQDVVRAAEDFVAATMPRVRIIETSDLALTGAHYQSDSMVTLGHRFSAELLKIWIPQASTRRRTRMLTIKTSHPFTEERRVYFTAVQAANLQNRMTGIAGSAFTCKLHKPGQAGSSTCANLPAELESSSQPGMYSVLLTQPESDTSGFATLVVTASGMEPREIPIYFEAAQFGQVAAGTLTSSAFTTNLTASTSDVFKDSLIRMLDNANASQVKKIGAFNGASKVITLATVGGTQQTLTSAPIAGDNFEILTR